MSRTYHDVRLLGVLCDQEFDPKSSLNPNAMLTLEYMGREIELPCCLPSDYLHVMNDQLNLIGFAQAIGDGEFHYWFRPYLDQSLRRRYELDNNDRIGWTNDTRPEGWTAPRVVIPGVKGQFVEDNICIMHLPVPPEFLDLCDYHDIRPWDMLRRFMADLCNLDSPQEKPRADGLCCSGSDEHMLARDYFERSQGVDLDDYDWP
ncbi:MAG TPA: hypothetical protein DCS07_15910 [Bdellovibrionales bacterium]|nr:hypothetical protein [Bdellovibrionales bacterium]